MPGTSNAYRTARRPVADNPSKSVIPESVEWSQDHLSIIQGIRLKYILCKAYLTVIQVGDLIA